MLIKICLEVLKHAWKSVYIGSPSWKSINILTTWCQVCLWRVEKSRDTAFQLCLGAETPSIREVQDIVIGLHLRRASKFWWPDVKFVFVVSNYPGIPTCKHVYQQKPFKTLKNGVSTILFGYHLGEASKHSWSYVKFVLFVSNNPGVSGFSSELQVFRRFFGRHLVKNWQVDLKFAPKVVFLYYVSDNVLQDRGCQLKKS